MPHDRILPAHSGHQTHANRNNAGRRKLSWLDFIIRHAGSVAVDHTHMLPLNTLEAELKSRATARATCQRC